MTNRPSSTSRRNLIRGAAIGVAAVGSGLGGAALAKAPGRKTWAPPQWDLEADIVVIGYGAAGISAAISARDAGQKVLVLEKDPEVRGGNTGVSGGLTRIITPIKDFVTYMKLCAWGTVKDDGLVEAHCKAVAGLQDWIKNLGGDTLIFDPNKLRPGLGTGGTPASLVQGLVSSEYSDSAGWMIKLPNGGGGFGQHLFAFLKGCAESRGISAAKGTILTATPAKELVQDPVTKEILGVRAMTGVVTDDKYKQSGGKQIFIKARKGVIMACGGYEYNPEIQDNFTGDTPHLWPHAYVGSPFNTGDGIGMATRAGAKLWHMNKKEINEYGWRAATEELGIGIAIEHLYGLQDGEKNPGILVNRYGKRFQNERHTVNHNDAIRPLTRFAEQFSPTEPDACEYPNIPVFWIFDDVRMKHGPLSPRGVYRWASVHNKFSCSMDNQVELEKGWIIKGDTVEELAQKITCRLPFGRTAKMDVQGLVKTIKDYNAYCAAGKDPEFQRMPASLLPLAKPPYYAVEIIESSVNTDGGPQHNQYSQTIDVDGNPIPRLYSCGEFGSIFGFLYYGGGNVSEGLAMGRVAAEHAAALQPWDGAARG